MRKLVPALAIGLLVAVSALGVGVKSAEAVASQARVVIVVGATQGTTGQYRTDADAAAAVFAKYTSNVIKVYSPNATWANVQAAAQGASVLVYLGHGSGYPNPYVGYLQPNGDNGMGLNAAAAGTDYNLQYYGENYMAQLGLAPNAVVILNHLCYASGDSEMGTGTPTFPVVQTGDPPSKPLRKPIAEKHDHRAARERADADEIPVHTASSAAVNSSRRSRQCSVPTEMRTRASVIPARANSSSENSLCVVVFG